MTAYPVYKRFFYGCLLGLMVSGSQLRADVVTPPSVYVPFSGMNRKVGNLMNFETSRENALIPQRDIYWSNLDFSSVSAYTASLEPYRRDFQKAIGIPDELLQNHAVTLKARYLQTYGNVDLYWWALKIGDTGLTEEALVGIPNNRKPPYPVAIGLNGSGGAPERVFGTDNFPDYESGFGMKLANEGYMVFVPYLVMDLWMDISSISQIDLGGLRQGIRIMGIETGLLIQSLNYLAQRPDVNADSFNVYGISYGGQLASYLGAADPRIKVTISSGAFVFDWESLYYWNTYPVYFLIDNGDARFTPVTISYLLAPRGFFEERGILDFFDDFNVGGAFSQLKSVYDRLGAGDLCQLEEGAAGHQVYLNGSLAFLKQVSPPAGMAPIIGDLDGDGAVTNADSERFAKIYLGLAPITGQDIAAGDVRPKPGTYGRPYGDGQLLADDYNWLLRRIANLETTP